MSSFSSAETWSVLIQIFLIAVALLAGNIIRRKVSFMNRSLIPTALIGGLLIFLLKIFPWFNVIIDKPTMEIITYHALALGFISMALRGSQVKGRTATTKVIESGMLTVGTYVIQGIVGLIITIILFKYFFASDKLGQIFYAGGLLLPMGYGQGPGQALNFGSIFQNWSFDQGLAFQGKDFGLSIAAIGFMVGSVVGVVYMNILRRRGKLAASVQSDFQEKHTLDEYETHNELPHSESIDKLTVVVCMILFTYLLDYLLMSFIGNLDLGQFGEKTIKPLVYGFNFFWGILFASLVKLVLKFLRSKKLMHREYLNDYLLNRCSGFSFDIMIVAGTAAISFENLKVFWLPLTIICFFGAIVTFLYVHWVSKEIYQGYQFQGFFAMFGMLTGTASNGMILLREIDPKYETPAANNLVLQSIPAVVFGLPMLLLMGYAPQSFKATMITLVVLVIMLVVFTLILFRRKIFKKR
jgi:glutamate:Na+ symporter, ESS family